MTEYSAPTIGDVCWWVEATGKMPRADVYLRSLRKVENFLKPEESRDVDWIVENIDMIFARTHLAPETVRYYRANVLFTFEQYLLHTRRYCITVSGGRTVHVDSPKGLSLQDIIQVATWMWTMSPDFDLSRGLPFHPLPVVEKRDTTSEEEE